MTQSNASRVENVRSSRGIRLPAEYRDFLASHRECDADRRQIVTSNPDYWGVRHLFELGGGSDALQLDRVLAFVGDVLPPKTLPIGEDEGGNFYLLHCGEGETYGNVSWWNHERELDDRHVEPVAPSFAAFLALLGPEE